MQLDDIELGLNSTSTSTNAPTPLRAATSTPRSPSPTADLAQNLTALNVDLTSDVEDFTSGDDEEEEQEEEEVPLAKSKKKNKRRKAPPPLSTFVSLAPSSDEDGDEDISHHGMARKGRKGKKGKSGGALGTPAVAAEPTLVEEQEREQEVKGKKSRRAKGKGKTPVPSGAATPVVVEGEQKVVAGEAQPGFGAEEREEGVEEAEMSKKDKRRLREAAKMAAGPDELVSELFL